MKKFISNVVNLDMTTATAESVEGLTIGNAVNVLVTPKTRPLLTQMSIDNIVNVDEIPDNVTLYQVNGNIVIDGNFETTTGTNVFPMLNGNILIKNDVTSDTLTRMFPYGGRINGNLTMPDTLSAIIHTLAETNGNTNIYPADTLLFDSHVKITNGFLSELPEGSKITLINGAVIASDTDADIFKKHIAEMTIFGDTILPQQLRNAFYGAAKRYDNAIEIPEGYIFQDEPITVAPSNLLTLKGKSIYTREDIHFMDGLNEALLRQMDFRLITEGTLILPENIAEAIFDRIQAKHIYTYRGKLIAVQNELPFAKPNEAVSYLIKSGGELTIPEAVSPADIQASVNEIFLYGDINLQENHLQAVNDKLAINQGGLNVPQIESEMDDESEDTAGYDVVISNAVNYKL
ncbi:MAG: hypothetical protein FWD03_08735 [Defluviitaleaceae bacterium]|nr:hypothetical protein [Defluviitaleaceae bacterium]